MHMAGMDSLPAKRTRREHPISTLNLSKLNIQAVQPAPLQHYHDNVQNPPDLDDEVFADLTAVLKALAKGSYPRLDAVPVALNAYNYSRGNNDGEEKEEPWVYFHPITVVPPEDVKMKKLPEIKLDNQVIEDLEKPWQSLQAGAQLNSLKRKKGRSTQQDPARYRFLCFIHKHRIDRRRTFQKALHTISIWDREWEELTWHDTYHANRVSRRHDIQRFWGHVTMPGLIGEKYPRDDFLSRIRYRTVYHTCEHVEDTLRETVPPRHTLWSVMSTALFHMNGARDPHISIVPDRLELFGGHAAELLPRFFAHLLLLCLQARPEWTRGEQERFLAQFRIIERLGWMKLHAREQLELAYSALDGNWDSDSDSDRTVAEESWEWMYAILRI